MMEFFRKYQRFFLICVTVSIVASFIFFGTFDTFSRAPEREDRIIATAIDGSPLKFSEVASLSRFLSSDREDIGRGMTPNFCNDGVLRYDLLQTGLADLIAAPYFEHLKEGLAQRLERMKRYHPYAHPRAPFFSVRAVWERFAPDLAAGVDALQAQDQTSENAFASFVKLYQMQSACPPEFVRRVLGYYAQQFPDLASDPALQYEDFALFGFHSIADWLGRDFVDLSAEFILNAARMAEKQGYRVSMEEAKGDMLANFHASMQKLQGDLTFSQHLRSLGFDEMTAIECWRSVLLFRRYFNGVGDAAFIDRMPYRNFSAFANETASVQMYELPVALQLKNAQDLAEFEAYVKMIADKHDAHLLPKKIRSLEEIEKQAPELVQSAYLVKMGVSSKEKVGLKASLKEILQWALDDSHWALLTKNFSLPLDAKTQDARYRALETIDPSLRAKVDLFIRSELVAANPEWVKEHVKALPQREQKIFVGKEWISLGGVQNPILLSALIDEALRGDAAARETLACYEEAGALYRIEVVEKAADRHLLTLQEAKEQGLLAKLAGKEKKDAAKDEEASRRLELFVREAKTALMKNGEDPRFINTQTDPIADQFKLTKTKRDILRKEKEEWMQNQAFIMMPRQWSDVHVSPNGNIAFFYFEEMKKEEAPVLEHLHTAQTLIADDAKRYVAEKLLAKVKEQHAMMIPLIQLSSQEEP